MLLIRLAAALSRTAVPMYICICHGVTDRAIRAAVAQGSRSLEDVSMATGCGTCCGQCRDAATAVIEGCAGREAARTARSCCAMVECACAG
jgi:bacterioferritin-associated ferredoxin